MAVDALFNRFDTDGSGTLSELELLTALRTMGVSKAVQDASPAIRGLVAEMRYAGNAWTLEEFRDVLTKHPEMMEAMGIDAGGLLNSTHEDTRKRFAGSGPVRNMAPPMSAVTAVATLAAAAKEK